MPSSFCIYEKKNLWWCLKTNDNKPDKNVLTKTNHGRSYGDSGKTNFRNRSIDDSFVAILLPQTPTDFVSTVILGDFFAQQKNFLVPFHFFVDCTVQSIANRQLISTKITMLVRHPFQIAKLWKRAVGLLWHWQTEWLTKSESKSIGWHSWSTIEHNCVTWWSCGSETVVEISDENWNCWKDKTVRTWTTRWIDTIRKRTVSQTITATVDFCYRIDAFKSLSTSNTDGWWKW